MQSTRATRGFSDSISGTNDNIEPGESDCSSTTTRVNMATREPSTRFAYVGDVIADWRATSNGLQLARVAAVDTSSDKDPEKGYNWLSVFENPNP